MKRMSQILAVTSALLYGAATAEATLIGDTVDILFSGNFDAAEQVVVQAGSAEVACPGPSPLCNTVLFDGESLDIEESSIIINLVSSFPAPQTLTFADLDWTDAPGILTGFTLVTNLPFLGQGDVTFTDDSLILDIGNGGAVVGTATITLLTDHQGPGLPEPSTLLLVGLGLGMGLARRRDRRPSAIS